MSSKSRAKPQPVDNPQPAGDLTNAPIRVQLLWSSFFPLALFALISVLAITNVFYRFSLDLVTQRNTTQAQMVAAHVEESLAAGADPQTLDLQAVLRSSGITNIHTVYIIDPQGVILNRFAEGPVQNLISFEGFAQPALSSLPTSRLIQLPDQEGEVMLSAARIPGSDMRVVLLESWAEIMAPTVNYQWLLSGITFLGVLFSLLMLHLAIGRIIRPITMLTQNADRAVPGSIFHPVQESGPQETRSLTRAFNQMVIRLAEQQSALRRLAHKALLSQEEERQRLSHELHDGTLQDLVGLSQRVELCRNEMENDAQAAQERLTEIHNLLIRTLDDVRSISIALRPPLLDELGLEVAVDSLCQKTSQSRVGLHCELSVSGQARRLAPDLELAVYRVVQEALTNIRKHAPDAALVQVDLVFSDTEIAANIRNDGASFASQDIQEYVRQGHIGLAGMYERARLFGGSLSIRSTPAKGTVISLRLPYMVSPDLV